MAQSAYRLRPAGLFLPAFGILSLLFCCAASSASTTDLQTAAPIERYLPEHGLAARKIYSTIEDADGFIWIASRQGLLRFDGYSFKPFQHDPENPDGPSASVPWHLNKDDKGRLWITTWGSGIDVLDTTSGRFTHHRHDPSDPSSLSNDNVWYVLQHSSGSIWVGTDTALNRFDEATGGFERFQPLNDGQPQAISVSSIAEDPDGMLWVGTYGGGVNRFDPVKGTFRTFTRDPGIDGSLSHDNIWSVVAGSDGRMWIATAEGLDRYDAIADRFIHYRHDPTDPRSLGSDAVNTLAAGDNGQIWAGTRGRGISIYQPGSDTFEQLRHDPDDATTLSSDSVWRIVRDRIGAFWISTDGGLNRYDPGANHFATLRRKPGAPNSLPSASVTAVARDAGGDLWIGTEAGLSRLSPKLDTATNFQPAKINAEGLTSDQITALVAQPDGTLWIGTNQGLNRFDPKTGGIAPVNSPGGARPSLHRININSIAADPDGVLWIAAFGPGLIRYDPAADTIKRYPPDNSDPEALQTGWLSTVMVARDGAIWIGGAGGLCRLDPVTETCTTLNSEADNSESSGLPGDTITTLYQDLDGAIWIGTDNGLARFDQANGAFSSVVIDHKPINEQIAGIAEDTAGNLWLSNSKGLHRLSHKDGSLRSYDRRDGLTADLFNLRTLHFDADGHLYAGSSNGLIHFAPAELKQNKVAPSVVFTQFRLLNDEVRSDINHLHGKQINAAKQIVIAPEDDVFSLGFAALNFRNPLKTTYAYRLDGFSKDWTHVDASQRLITFTNLDPGSYVLQVKAANADGVWSVESRTLDIMVQPFWWETRLARAGAITAPVALTLLIAGWRLTTLRRHNRALCKLADERRIAEEKASVLADRLRRLIDGANAPIIAVDTHLRITEWNAAAADLTKTAGRDAKGLDLIEAFAPPHAREELSAIFAQAFSGRNTLAFEFPLCPQQIDDADAPELLLLFSVTPQYDVEGRIVGAIGIGQDTTELKRTEEVLRRTQKMDVVGQLAGGVAHDFNNLLAIMIGNLDLAAEDISEGSEAADQIEKALKAATKATNLTSKLLAFSRQSLQPSSPLNINAVIGNVIDLTAKSLTAEITVKTDLVEDLWLCDIDPGDLEDALINLSLNARDAMPDGGQLLIQTQNIELGEVYCSQHSNVVPGDYAMLSVGDTGTGIPEHIVPRIFDPFFTTKDTGKGTGLGLAMVYAFVKRSGGHIDLQTAEGHGTTFKIFLPKSDSAELDTNEPATPDTSPGGSETILVIDDEIELLQMVATTLRRAGYTVLSATNATEGLALLESSPSIDLLLSDVVMPGDMNGLEVARIALVRYPNLPIIMTSGFAEKMRYGEDYADLLDTLLVKPYRRTHLLQRIRDTLDGAGARQTS